MNLHPPLAPYRQAPIQQPPLPSYAQNPVPQYQQPNQPCSPPKSFYQKPVPSLDDSLQAQIDIQNKLQQSIESQVLSKVIYEPPFFTAALASDELILNPFQLQFEPQSFWIEVSQDFTFGMLVNKFFRANKTRITKFIYKLYDMLLITSKMPIYKGIVGVNWVTYKIFSVNIQCIAAMLNIPQSSIDSYLFGPTGHFTTLNFAQITPSNFQEAGLSSFPDISEPNIILMFHRDQRFVHKELTSMELDDIQNQCGTKKYSQVNNNKIARPRYPAFTS